MSDIKMLVKMDGEFAKVTKCRRKGGKLRDGVYLNGSNRDDILGRAVPIGDSLWLVIKGILRRRYHEDAPPLYIGYGRKIKSARSAEKIESRHPSVIRAGLRNAVGKGEHDAPLPDGAEKIGEIESSSYYGDFWYSLPDGSAVVLRTEYDWPPSLHQASIDAATAQHKFSMLSGEKG